MAAPSGPTGPTDWDPLLAHLAEGPRENGSAGLEHAADFLVETLAVDGVDLEVLHFEAQPYGLRLTGVLLLVGALLYARLVRERRHGAALAATLLVAGVALAQVEQIAPILGRIGARTQRQLIAERPASGPAVQRLIFSAHYDTKTDLLDHVERAPVDLLGAVAAPILLLGAVLGLLSRRRPGLARAPRWAAVFAVAYGGLAFVALSGGAFQTRRSPGALDDGAACAVGVRLIRTLAEAPLARTDVQLWLLSAEEVGVQGSPIAVAQRFPEPPALPTWVVNLEAIGASPRLAVLDRERSVLSSRRPDAALVARLDAVQRRLRGQPLGHLTLGGGSDARSFLARGIPAATLVSRRPGRLFERGLHSAADDRARLDAAALDSTLATLLAFGRDVDARPLR